MKSLIMPVKSVFSLLTAVMVAVPAAADMERLDDEALSSVSGQGGGMSLSGDVTFNRDGGPLHDGGARIAARLSEEGGWFVLDDLQGTIAFEGLTLRTRHIDSGFDGDGAQFNREVLEIGLPDTLRFEDFSYTMATSSTRRPTDDGFQQTDRLTVEMNGEATLEGNMLVFPVGNP